MPADSNVAAIISKDDPSAFLSPVVLSHGQSVWAATGQIG
jgi:hypothetical protein